MSKLDDLTIFLKAQDKTKGTFSKVGKRIEDMSGKAKFLAKGFLAIGAAAVTGFAAAVTNGAMLSSELTRMSNSIGTTTKEADELYKIIREGAPATNIDQLGEGILTLKEGFFDARAESGPLFDLIKDFGSDIDLNVETPRLQLLEFLKAMRQIESPTIRAGAAVANFGGEDAKSIITITNDVKLLDQTIARLAGTAEDLPTFLSLAQIQNMEDAKVASNALGDAWEDFSTTAYSLVAPALAWATTKLTGFIEWVDKGVTSLGEFFGIFDSKSVGLETFSEAETQIKNISAELDRLNAKKDKLLTSKTNQDIENSKQMTNLKKSIAKQEAELATFSEVKKMLRTKEAAEQRVIDESERARKLAADTAAAKIAGQKVAEATMKRFNSAMKSQQGMAAELLLGVGDLDLGELMNKRDGLAMIEEGEILKIMGLDLSEARKVQLKSILAADMQDVLDETNAQIVAKTPELTIFDGLKVLSAANDLQNNFTSKIFGDSSGDAEAAEIKKVADAAAGLQSIMGSAASAVGTLANSFAKTKGQARAFVAIQQTLAMVSAYSAATQALAEAKGDPVLRFAAYAAVLAQGLAGVAAIKSAGSGLGASGGGTTAPTVTGPTGATGGTGFADSQNTGANSTTTKNISITIAGGGLFLDDAQKSLLASSLLDEINDNEGTGQLNADRIAA